MKELIKQPLSMSWNILLVVAASLIILNALYHDTFLPYGDFHVAFQSAQHLLSGSNLYGGFYIYPPLYAFLMTSLVPLTEPVARWVVLSGCVVVLALTAIVAWRMLADACKINYTGWQAAGAAALAVLLTQDQILHVFREGQNDIFILFGFMLALYWLDRRPLTAGAILGIIVMIKYQALFLLPLLLLRGRWRVIAGLCAGVVAGALLPALLIGWNKNLAYLQIIAHGFFHIVHPNSAEPQNISAAPPILWIGNISMTSGIARIFQAHGWGLQSALGFLAVVAALVFLFLWKSFQQNGIAFIWRPYRLENSPKEKALSNLEWNILLLCMLVFSPNCTRRHLMLLFNFNLLAVMMLLFPQPGLKRWPIILAIVCAQLGQLNYGGIRYGQYVGLAGWGYLIFLFIILNSCLAYYRAAYKSPITSPLVGEVAAHAAGEGY